MRRTLAGIGVLAAVLAPSNPPDAATPVRLPPVAGEMDYQLGGAYPPDPGVAIVVRDRADPPAQGVYNVCYVNAFQTQPGDAERWADRPLLVLHDGDQVIHDPDWPDEAVLAPVGARRQRALLAVVGPWIDRCATDGYDAVELDNLDTFARFPDRIPEADAVRYAGLLIDRAHRVGLAVAQKNTIELLDRRAELGFDFVISEECARFDECGQYVAAFGGLVYDVEYDEEGFTAACDLDLTMSVVGRDRELAPAGAPGHVRRTCP